MDEAELSKHARDFGLCTNRIAAVLSGRLPLHWECRSRVLRTASFLPFSVLRGLYWAMEMGLRIWPRLLLRTECLWSAPGAIQPVGTVMSRLSSIPITPLPQFLIELEPFAIGELLDQKERGMVYTQGLGDTISVRRYSMRLIPSNALASHICIRKAPGLGVTFQSKSETGFSDGASKPRKK